MQNKTFGADSWGRARPGRPPLTRGYILYSALIRMCVWPSVPTFKYSNDILAFHLSRHQRLIVSATQSHGEKDFMCELTLSMGCDTESVKRTHSHTDRIKYKHLPHGRSKPWSQSALTGCADCHQLVAVSGFGKSVLIWQLYSGGADLCHRLELSLTIHTFGECEHRLTCAELRARETLSNCNSRNTGLQDQ